MLSPISALLSFLLKALLLRPILKPLLDLLTLVSQLEGQHVPGIFLVAVPAPILSGDTSLASVLRLGVVLAHSVVALGRLDTDVLVEELFSGEVIHEVLRCDEAALLVCVFEQDLIEALDDRLHDLLEAELHRPILFLEGANVFAELLVDLANHTIQPVLDISVGQLDLLAHLDSLVVELLCGLDLDM